MLESMLTVELLIPPSLSTLLPKRLLCPILRVSLIRHSPLVEPPHVAVLLIVANHAEDNGREEDEEADHEQVQDRIDGPLVRLVLPRYGIGDPVDQEPKAQDRIVESGVVVVNVGDARHDDEREVVEKPAQHGIETRVVDVIDLRLLELDVASLPADQVPANYKTENTERSSAAPVDDRVSKEEVFGDAIVPAAHTKTHIQNGPLPKLGGKIILLIGVRD